MELSSPVYTEPTTPLGTGGIFTGAWVSVFGLGYSFINAISSSDQGGTLYVEQSIDGINVARGDNLATATDPSTGGQGALLKVAIGMQYVRVRYVNGATPQVTFILSRRLVVA